MSAVLGETELRGDAAAAGTAQANTAHEPIVPMRSTVDTATTAVASSVTSTPTQRLAASRLKLKAAMTPPPLRPRTPSTTTPRDWLKSLPDLPGVGVLIEAVKSWWQYHPLRPVATVVTEVTNVAARPYATKNPLALVGGAALVGAALAWWRPWRWLLRSVLVAGVLPQLATRIIAKLPIESWLTMAVNMVKAQPAAAAAASPPLHPVADSAPR